MDVDVGEYELIGPLGQGGMAETYLARRLGAWGHFERQCVVKLPTFGLRDHDDEEIRRLFALEVQLSARLQHPNIVMTLDTGETRQGVPYLVMEYIDGVSLATLLAWLTQQQALLPIDVATYIAASIAQALAYAHALTHEGKPLHFVHRDVTPDNIMLDRFGHVKLIDPGIAVCQGRGRFTETHKARGRTAYMSPEHLGEIEHLDGRSDLFSLGTVLYQMLTGSQPFEGGKATLEATLMSIRDSNFTAVKLLARNLPRPLASLVQQMLDPKKDSRPATGTAVALQLETFFRPITTQVEAASLVQTVMAEENAAACALELAPDVATEPSASEPTPALSTVRPPSSGEAARSRRLPRDRRRSFLWGRRPRNLVYATAAVMGLGAAASTALFAASAREPALRGSPSPAPQRSAEELPSERPATAAAPTGPSLPAALGAGQVAAAHAPPAEPSENLNTREEGQPGSSPAPLTASLTVKVAGGAIWLKRMDANAGQKSAFVGEKSVTLRGLSPGRYEVGLSPDRHSAIDERHTVMLHSGHNRTVFSYLPAGLPTP